MKTLLIPALLLITACGNTSSAPSGTVTLQEVPVTAGTYTTVGPLAAFPTAVNSQITDSVTQANPPGLEALKLLDHMNQNLEAILAAKGINVKDQTCEPPPVVCR